MPRVAAKDFLFDVDLLLAARDTGNRVLEVPTVWIDQDGSRVDPVADATRSDSTHRDREDVSGTIGTFSQSSSLTRA